MKNLVFDYSPLPGFTKAIVLAPMVPVTFINGKYSFDTFAFVDSGADSGLISTGIADALNIKWEKLEQKTGYTTSGVFKYRTFENLEAEIEYNNFILAINIAEGVSPFKCILGRSDLFKKAEIRFLGYDSKFELIFRALN